MTDSSEDRPEPQNRLDRALWRLEQTIDVRARAGLQRLAAAIEARRKVGPFDEWPIVEELGRIESRGYMMIERELDVLATRVTSM